MMRSRALPDDFDMASALHSPFGNSHGLGTPLASPGSYNPSFSESNMMRPLSIDTFRRGPLDSHMSPTGISPAFGGFTFTPPQSATDTISPVSAHEGSPFGFHSTPIDTSPRTSNPFSMPVSNPTAYAAQHSIPRLSLHADRIARSRAESLQSPLRTSMSYTGSHDSSDSHDSRSYSSSMMPYGIGYSCKFSSPTWLMLLPSNTSRFPSTRLRYIKRQQNAVLLQRRSPSHRAEHSLRPSTQRVYATDRPLPFLLWLTARHPFELWNASNECTAPHVVVS